MIGLVATATLRMFVGARPGVAATVGERSTVSSTNDWSRITNWFRTAIVHHPGDVPGADRAGVVVPMVGVVVISSRCPTGLPMRNAGRALP